MRIKNKYIRPHILLILILPFIITSCTASIEEADENMTAEQLILNSMINQANIKNYDVFGDVRFEADDEVNNGSITLCIFKPDTLYAKIQGPFGVTGAVILIDAQNFSYYNVVDNYVITGSPTPVNIGAILRFQTTREFLIKGLSGAFDYERLRETISSFRIMNIFYIIEERTDEGLQEFHFKPGNNLIYKYTHYDVLGDKTVEIIYDKYRSVDNAFFPAEIDMINYKSNQRIFIQLNDIKINIPRFRYNVAYPSNVNLIEWN